MEAPACRDPKLKTEPSFYMESFHIPSNPEKTSQDEDASELKEPKIFSKA